MKRKYAFAQTEVSDFALLNGNLNNWARRQVFAAFPNQPGMGTFRGLSELSALLDIHDSMVKAVALNLEDGFSDADFKIAFNKRLLSIAPKEFRPELVVIK